MQQLFLFCDRLVLILDDLEFGADAFGLLEVLEQRWLIILPVDYNSFGYVNMLVSILPLQDEVAATTRHFLTIFKLVGDGEVLVYRETWILLSKHEQVHLMSWHVFCRASSTTTGSNRISFEAGRTVMVQLISEGFIGLVKFITCVIHLRDIGCPCRIGLKILILELLLQGQPFVFEGERCYWRVRNIATVEVYYRSGAIVLDPSFAWLFLVKVQVLEVGQKFLLAFAPVTLKRRYKGRLPIER